VSRSSRRGWYRTTTRRALPARGRGPRDRAFYGAQIFMENIHSERNG
jgi:hypothetical protein